MRETDLFQREIATNLRLILKREGYKPEVRTPWPAFAGLGRRIYSPKVDIAVGPFATGNRRYEDKYDRMVHSFNQLIDEWVNMFRENWQRCIGDQYWTVPPISPSGYKDFIEYRANRNARCFVAIELENETTRKHLMGSIVNAGALGRVGVLVAWQEKVLRAAIRMREYFDFLQKVEKRTFDMSDVIVITRDQLAASLEI